MAKIKKMKSKLGYWYMRYLLVTELFMVEKWERYMFHVITLILLAILGVINRFIVAEGVRILRQLYFYYTTDTSGVNLDKDITLS